MYENRENIALDVIVFVILKCENESSGRVKSNFVGWEEKGAISARRVKRCHLGSVRKRCDLVSARKKERSRLGA